MLKLLMPFVLPIIFLLEIFIFDASHISVYPCFRYEEYVQEYREKYDSYCSINKTLESYRFVARIDLCLFLKV